MKDIDLISQLLKLEAVQQEKVLVYIKGLLITDEMNKRAEQSKKDIAEGKTISMMNLIRTLNNGSSKERAILLR